NNDAAPRPVQPGYNTQHLKWADSSRIWIGPRLASGRCHALSVALHVDPALIEPSGDQIAPARAQIEPSHVAPPHACLAVAADLQDQLPIVGTIARIVSISRFLHRILDREGDAADLVDHVAFLTERVRMRGKKITPELTIGGGGWLAARPCVVRFSTQ